MLWRTQFFLVLFVAMTIMLAAFINCMTLLWATWPRSGPSDVTAPTISSVVHVAQIYDPYLFVGRVAVFRVTFSEAMDQAYGTGTRLQLNIATPAGDEWADFVEWESPTVARYSLTITAAMSDTNGISANSLDINSGDLKDLAGNNADLVFDPIPLDDIRVVMRGMFYGTDFTQGADAQKLYGTVGSTQVSAIEGQLGDTTGADGNDPAFASHGMTFDANKVVKAIGANGDFDRLCKTNVPWTVYFRARVDISVSGAWSIFFSNADPTGSGNGTYFHGYTSGGNLGLTANFNASGNNWNAGLSGAQWATFTFSCDGSNNVSCWVNGALVSAQSVTSNVSPNKKGRIQQVEGYEAVAYIGGMPMRMRFAGMCDVEHSVAEVAANHAFIETLSTT